MKKIFTLLLISTLFLSACNNEEMDQNQEVGVTEETDEDQEIDETKEMENSEDTEDEDSDSRYQNFELGETIEIGESELTVKKLEIITDVSGRENVKLIYDWTNTSTETRNPSSVLIFQGFQEGIETDRSSSFYEDSLDQSEFKEIRPDTTIENVESAIGIDDMSLPIELEIKENPISPENTSYILVIDDLNSL